MEDAWFPEFPFPARHALKGIALAPGHVLPLGVLRGGCGGGGEPLVMRLLLVVVIGAG